MAARKISLLLLLSVLIPACAEKPPIPEKKLVDFYIQLQFLDAQYGTDAALQKQKVDSLMKAFNIDKTVFDSTMSWYDKRPEKWEEFFFSVQKKLSEMKPDYIKSRHR
jgi:Domain of unknown function (DUF4296)